MGGKENWILFLIICRIVYVLADDGPQDTPPKEDSKDKEKSEDKSKGSDGDDESGTNGSTEYSLHEQQTNLPLAAFDDALQLEVGDYSTVSYSYNNDQYMNWDDTPHSMYICNSHYIRCILSQTVRHPVCAMHKPDKKIKFFKHLPSLCDMFWYNCRRGRRYFFAYKIGVCFIRDHNEKDILFAPKK